MGAYRRESLAWGKWLESWSARREKTEAVSSEDDTLDSPVILEAPSPLPTSGGPLGQAWLPPCLICAARVTVWVHLLSHSHCDFFSDSEIFLGLCF